MKKIYNGHEDGDPAQRAWTGADSLLVSMYVLWEIGCLDARGRGCSCKLAYLPSMHWGLFSLEKASIGEQALRG